MHSMAIPVPVEQTQPDRTPLLAALDAAEQQRADAWHAVNEVQRTSHRTHRIHQHALYRAMYQAHSSEAAYFLALLAYEGVDA